MEHRNENEADLIFFIFHSFCLCCLRCLSHEFLKLNYPDFNEMKRVAFGCLVFLTINNNLQRGLANGTTTTIQIINLTS